MLNENIQDSSAKPLILMAVGDMVFHRDNPEVAFELCKSTLEQADIRFGVLESTISDRGYHDPSFEPLGFRHRPESVSALTYAGFDVISPNGNHLMNWGSEAVIDTFKILRQSGIQSVGIGENLAEARKPVFIEKNGTRIAFLSYNSITEPNNSAKDHAPGGNPIKIHTIYEPAPSHPSPGAPAKINTFADYDDLISMRNAVKQAREMADIVIVSYHCGVSYKRGYILDYQREVTRAMIDSGADSILCSHSHMLKGIEVYKGKVIFYSMGNFTFDHSPEVSKRFPDDPYLGHFVPDARKTLITKITIENKRIIRVSFLPVLNTREMKPEVMKNGSQGFNEILEWILNSTWEAGIDTLFKVEGDEVLIITD